MDNRFSDPLFSKHSPLFLWLIGFFNGEDETVTVEISKVTDAFMCKSKEILQVSVTFVISTVKIEKIICNFEI